MFQASEMDSIFQCDFCPIKSPNEDLAISHVLHKHLDLIKTNQNWQECNLCLKFIPAWKEHECWTEGQCPLCQMKICETNKQKQKIFHHMRSKHYEEIKVRLSFLLQVFKNLL